MACPPDDPRVVHAVASIQGQCLVYAPNPVSTRLLGHWPPTDDELDRVAGRIAEFSLAGIRALARPDARPEAGVTPSPPRSL